MAKKSTDEAVMALLQKVAEKKAEILKATQKPQWKTNCTIGFDPETTAGRVNIMTVRDINKLLDIECFLLQRNDYQKKAAAQLGVEPNYEYMGYSIADWEADLKFRADQLGIEQKKRELDELDKRVNSLVSPDQRREMELEALQKVLG